MGLQTATILEGATCSFSGGTSKAYGTDGLKVNNGIHLIDTTVTDIRTQPSITAKSIPASMNSDETWSNAKRELVHTRPKVITSGKQKFPNIRITLTVHPENTQAEIDALILHGAQMLQRADFLNLLRVGSLT